MFIIKHSLVSLLPFEPEVEKTADAMQILTSDFNLPNPGISAVISPAGVYELKHKAE